MLSEARKKLNVYSHLIQKKFLQGVRRIGLEPKVKRYKNYPAHDSHIVDDLPLTINPEEHKKSERRVS